MDELVRQVTERTGISEEQARGAVETVLGFLRDKLPAPIAGQLDHVVAGGGEGKQGGGLSDLTGGLGGVFGGNN
jgi:hypothetical protein